LSVLRREGQYDIVGLVTTVNTAANRVAMHGVRDELLRAQADAVGLPLWRVDIPSQCSNAEYEEAMATTISRAVAQGVTHMAFGDLFLGDVRAYREQRLTGTGVTPIFPLWKRDTRQLAHHMLDARVKAVITCVDPAQLPRTFAGRDFDAAFLADLPDGCDPCGENGEFHSFVWNAPGFSRPVCVSRGEIVARDGFIFADLLPS
jgi:uncharacterized protein (TIGR00290 family)